MRGICVRIDMFICVKELLMLNWCLETAKVIGAHNLVPWVLPRITPLVFSENSFRTNILKCGKLPQDRYSELCQEIRMSLEYLLKNKNYVHTTKWRVRFVPFADYIRSFIEEVTIPAFRDENTHVITLPEIKFSQAVCDKIEFNDEIFTIDSAESRTVTRIKKIWNILFLLEKILLCLEETPHQITNTDSLKQINDAYNLIFELDIDLLNFFQDMFGGIKDALRTKYNVDLDDTQKNHDDLKQCLKNIGFYLGLSLSQLGCSKYDYQILLQIRNMLPTWLSALTALQKTVVESSVKQDSFAPMEHESSVDQAKVLKDKLDSLLQVKQLGSLSTVKFILEVVSILAKPSLAKLLPIIQGLGKDHKVVIECLLKYVKYDFLPPILARVETIENETLLAHGTLLAFFEEYAQVYYNQLVENIGDIEYNSDLKILATPHWFLSREKYVLDRIAKFKEKQKNIGSSDPSEERQLENQIIWAQASLEKYQTSQHRLVAFLEVDEMSIDLSTLQINDSTKFSGAIFRCKGKSYLVVEEIKELINFPRECTFRPQKNKALILPDFLVNLIIERHELQDTVWPKQSIELSNYFYRPEIFDESYTLDSLDVMNLSDLSSLRARYMRHHEGIVRVQQHLDKLTADQPENKKHIIFNIFGYLYNYCEQGSVQFKSDPDDIVIRSFSTSIASKRQESEKFIHKLDEKIKEKATNKTSVVVSQRSKDGFLLSHTKYSEFFDQALASLKFMLENYTSQLFQDKLTENFDNTRGLYNLSTDCYEFSYLYNILQHAANLSKTLESSKKYQDTSHIYEILPRLDALSQLISLNCSIFFPTDKDGNTVNGQWFTKFKKIFDYQHVTLPLERISSLYGSFDDKEFSWLVLPNNTNRLVTDIFHNPAIRSFLFFGRPEETIEGFIRTMVENSVGLCEKRSKVQECAKKSIFFATRFEKISALNESILCLSLKNKNQLDDLIKKNNAGEKKQLRDYLYYAYTKSKMQKYLAEKAKLKLALNQRLDEFNQIFSKIMEKSTQQRLEELTAEEIIIYKSIAGQQLSIPEKSIIASKQNITDHDLSAIDELLYNIANDIFTNYKLTANDAQDILDYPQITHLFLRGEVLACNLMHDEEFKKIFKKTIHDIYIIKLRGEMRVEFKRLDDLVKHAENIKSGNTCYGYSYAQLLFSLTGNIRRALFALSTNSRLNIGLAHGHIKYIRENELVNIAEPLWINHEVLKKLFCEFIELMCRGFLQELTNSYLVPLHIENGNQEEIVASALLAAAKNYCITLLFYKTIITTKNAQDVVMYYMQKYMQACKIALPASNEFLNGKSNMDVAFQDEFKRYLQDFMQQNYAGVKKVCTLLDLCDKYKKYLEYVDGDLKRLDEITSAPSRSYLEATYKIFWYIEYFLKARIYYAGLTNQDCTNRILQLDNFSEQLTSQKQNDLSTVISLAKLDLSRDTKTYWYPGYFVCKALYYLLKLLSKLVQLLFTGYALDEAQEFDNKLDKAMHAEYIYDEEYKDKLSLFFDESSKHPVGLREAFQCEKSF